MLECSTRGVCKLLGTPMSSNQSAIVIATATLFYLFFCGCLFYLVVADRRDDSQPESRPFTSGGRSLARAYVNWPTLLMRTTLLSAPPLVVGTLLLWDRAPSTTTGTEHMCAARAHRSGFQQHMRTQAVSNRNATFHLVVAHYSDCLSWIWRRKEPFSICDKVGNPRYEGTGECDFKSNRGFECSSFLKFIVVHYQIWDQLLPRFVCFIHGHNLEAAAMSSMDAALDDVARGHFEWTSYLTLNGHFRRDPSWFDPEWKHAVARFNRSFPRFAASRWMRHLKLDRKGDARADSSAQFCVQSSAVHNLPKDGWVLLLDEIDHPHGSVSGKAQCIAMELMWHVLFGQELYLNPWQFYVGTGMPWHAATSVVNGGSTNF